MPRFVVSDATWKPGGAPIIERFSFSVELGSKVAVVGRSGCGKSSLLRIVAGLRELESGTIVGVPVRRSFVFQDPALLPWLSLAQNVALPLSLGGRGNTGHGKTAPKFPTEIVHTMLVAVGLAGHQDKLPSALSGGQRMRASLARALVSEPEILLLDEPFAALDAHTRREMHNLVLAHAVGRTVLLVTHDLADAARLADRVVVVDGPPLAIVVDVPVSFAYPRTPEQVAGVVKMVEEATR